MGGGAAPLIAFDGASAPATAATTVDAAPAMLDEWGRPRAAPRTEALIDVSETAPAPRAADTDVLGHFLAAPGSPNNESGAMPTMSEHEQLALALSLSKAEASIKAQRDAAQTEEALRLVHQAVTAEESDPRSAMAAAPAPAPAPAPSPAPAPALPSGLSSSLIDMDL